MSNPLTPLVLLVLAQLPTIATAQFATGYSFTSWETTPLATYQFAGTLTNFTPPPDCTTGDLFSVTSEFTVFSGSSRQYIRSYHSVGCYSNGPKSCCPSGWQGTAYYTAGSGGGGSCPAGYSLMPSVTSDSFSSGTIYYYPVISLRSGDAVALPCCPTITFSHSRGSTSGVLQPRQMHTVTITPSTGTSSTEIRCGYLQYDNLVTYTESGTYYSVFYEYLANPIYIFDENATRTSGVESTTTTGVGSTSLPAVPGSSVTSSIAPSGTMGPSGTATSNENQGSGKSGLSVGAIAGIAAGVGVPVIAIIVYLIYRLSRRNSGAVASGSPWGGPGKNEIGGIEPGIVDNAGEYGGIQRSGVEKTYG